MIIVQSKKNQELDEGTVRNYFGENFVVMKPGKQIAFGYGFAKGYGEGGLNMFIALMISCAAHN